MIILIYLEIIDKTQCLSDQIKKKSLGKMGRGFPFLVNGYLLITKRKHHT